MLEACNQGKAEMKTMIRIIDNMITRILMIPQTAPKELRYIDMGHMELAEKGKE